MSNQTVRFVNELGNRITISVQTEVRDRDALCTACRWRFAHAPDCERVNDPWPMIPRDDGAVLVGIEGPTSLSENFLTPLEASHLAATLKTALSP